MTDDPIDQIDRVWRSIDRPVWIITASDGARRGGLLATWFSQASLDRGRPVALAGIAPNHFTAELIDAGGSFAAHTLARGDSDLAWQFCLASGRNVDKLADVDHTRGVGGLPILARCQAWLACRVFHHYDAGDRLYYWADVVDGALLGGEPLLTEHDLLAAATSEQRAQLLADRDADIARHRPLHDRWRASLPDWRQ